MRSGLCQCGLGQADGVIGRQVHRFGAGSGLTILQVAFGQQHATGAQGGGQQGGAGTGLAQCPGRGGAGGQCHTTLQREAQRGAVELAGNGGHVVALRLVGFLLQRGQQPGGDAAFEEVFDGGAGE